MSNYLINFVMVKIFKLKFSKNGALKSSVEVARFNSDDAAVIFFREYYESLSEDYFVELWNDFVFYVRELNCVFVFRDLG